MATRPEAKVARESGPARDEALLGLVVASWLFPVAAALAVDREEVPALPAAAALDDDGVGDEPLEAALVVAAEEEADAALAARRPWLIELTVEH